MEFRVGGGAVKEGGERVVDSVDDCKFFVGGEDARLGELGGGFGARGGGARGGGWGGRFMGNGLGANESIK